MACTGKNWRPATRAVKAVFDPRLAVVENMVVNRHLMVRLVRELALPEMGFMVRMGVLFGLAIGTAQRVLWALTHNHLVLPSFGAFVGFFSDWLAMTMIFAPRTRRRYLGLFLWHGLFFKRREELSRAYARMASDALLTPAVLLRAILDGPMADRLFAMVATEAQRALKEEEGFARPVLDLAIGSARYHDLRDAVQARAPQAAARIEPQLERFALSTWDIETLVGDAMIEMDEDEYEDILRPMFKDDEWVVIVVGGILGGLVGELQLLILTSI